MPLDMEALASEVVLLVKSAIGPVLERVAAAEGRLAVLPEHGQSIGALIERVVAVELKAATPTPAPAVDLDPLNQRIAAVEASVTAAPPADDLPDDDVSAQCATLLLKELPGLHRATRQLIQRRVIRDSTGKIERVVEEPAL